MGVCVVTRLVLAALSALVVLSCAACLVVRVGDDTVTVFLCTAWVLTLGVVVYALVPSRSDVCRCGHSRAVHDPHCVPLLCECVAFERDWWPW